MFISICIRHQQICIDGERWRFSIGDVTETAVVMGKPTCITRCPQCEREEQVERDFLQGIHGRKNATIRNLPVVS